MAMDCLILIRSLCTIHNIHLSSLACRGNVNLDKGIILSFLGSSSFPRMGTTVGHQPGLVALTGKLKNQMSRGSSPSPEVIRMIALH